MNKLFTCLAIYLAANSVFAQEMDFRKLKLIIAKKAAVINEENNVVEYEFDDVRIYLITDENANRMRIMAAVVEESELKKDDLLVLMKANFDRALDAKYALSNGILWSVFAHPLKELYENQVTDALYQVKNLVSTYGTTYSSGSLIFGGDN